jgi:predicted nucleic acid-binding protein
MADRRQMNSSARTATAAGGEMYLDSAIIVKLLVREHDSELFDAALSGHSLDSSELCLTEVCFCLLSKERSRSISVHTRQNAMERFNEMVRDETLRLLPLNRCVLERAEAILQACHPQIDLRARDALHLATCDLHHCATLCAIDRRMRSAGAQLAMKLFPASAEDAGK